MTDVIRLPQTSLGVRREVTTDSRSQFSGSDACLADFRPPQIPPNCSGVVLGVSPVRFTSSFIFTCCPPFWLHPQCLLTLQNSRMVAGCQRPEWAQWSSTKCATWLPPPASVGPEAASGRPRGPECAVQGAVTNEGAALVTALIPATDQRGRSPQSWPWL